MSHAQRIHGHLSCSDRDDARMGSNNLMFWTATQFAIDQGLRQFHLGGGVEPRDGLFRFKHTFGGRELEYSVSGLWPIHLTGVARHGECSLCCCPHPSFTGPREPPGAHGPFADPKRPLWNAHPAGSPSELPNSPTPVKWIGQSGLIIDAQQYQAHVERRAKECDSTSDALLRSNYFPAYRAGKESGQTRQGLPVELLHTAGVRVDEQ
jgi:hypothetical protein